MPLKFHNEWRWLEFSLLRQRHIEKPKMLSYSPETISVTGWETVGWGD